MGADAVSAGGTARRAAGPGKVGASEVAAGPSLCSSPVPCRGDHPSGCGRSLYVVAGCSPADREGSPSPGSGRRPADPPGRAGPGVHARNSPTSRRPWDARSHDSTAWGGWSPRSTGDDAAAARATTISLPRTDPGLALHDRGRSGQGARAAGWRMACLLPTDYTATKGDDPAAPGNRIGAAISPGRTDGSWKSSATPTAYRPVNPCWRSPSPALMVTRIAAASLAKQIAQNGLLTPARCSRSSATSGERHALCPAAVRRWRPDRSCPRLSRRPGNLSRAEGEVTDVISVGGPRRDRRVTIDIGPGGGRQRAWTNDGDGHDGIPRAASRMRPTSSSAATSPACWPSSGRPARSQRRRRATGT
jgi:hypothetical protein